MADPCRSGLRHLAPPGILAGCPAMDGPGFSASVRPRSPPNWDSAGARRAARHDPGCRWSNGSDG
jgi:hypothetical protein